MLFRSVLLDHHHRQHLHHFIGGEPALTAQAFPPAADGEIVIGMAGIHHLAFLVSAEGTFHGFIPSNSVVFCDPPYKDSEVKYNTTKFNHEEFYEWCLEKAKYNDVYVTEYNIEHPHFQLLGEKGRQISLNAQGNKGIKAEKLYKVMP